MSEDNLISDTVVISNLKDGDTVEIDTKVGSFEEKLQETPCEKLGMSQKSNSRYKFIRSIGFGGMKAVLLVLDTDTGREVAMAMMPDAQKRPQEDVENFIREARITALLEHPNIVPVYDIGIDLSGAPFYIMKYLRGQTLTSILRQVRKEDSKLSKKFKIKDLLRIYVRVCNAIDFAHSKGIIHLDIKPDNILVGAYGEVIVADWGLAATSNANISGRPAGKGTPCFMAPEQMYGDDSRPDIRSDIYGLGAVLYSMLTFKRPLAELNYDEVIEATVSGKLPPPSERAHPQRAVPDALEAVCLKAMSLDPNDRYQSVAELRAEIQSFRDGYATEAQQASTLTKTALFVNRNFWVTFAWSIIMLLVAFILFLLFAEEATF